jgi:hypothetical protein
VENKKRAAPAVPFFRPFTTLKTTRKKKDEFGPQCQSYTPFKGLVHGSRHRLLYTTMVIEKEICRLKCAQERASKRKKNVERRSLAEKRRRGKTL